jgi:hypothetical protein
MIRAAAWLALALLAGGPAWGNDSSGFQGTGGIELAANPAVRMVSEDLFISLGQIRVSYVFRNVTRQPVTTLVVFPFPDLDLSQGLSAPNWAFPVKGSNFLDFRVWVDGQAVQPALERRAFLHGRDVTAEVAAAGALDVAPWQADPYHGETAGLPEAALAQLRRQGLVADGEDPDTPQWQLRTRYYWTQTFPPGRDVRVRHTYRPFVGSALMEGVRQVDGRAVFGRLVGEHPADRDRYCLDAGTRRALVAAERSGTRFSQVAELEYILTTARNWAGPIGHFHLTIDKGSPRNVATLCWDGLHRTGATTFEASADNFVPVHDIALLVFRADR